MYSGRKVLHDARSIAKTQKPFTRWIQLQESKQTRQACCSPQNHILKASPPGLNACLALLGALSPRPRSLILQYNIPCIGMPFSLSLQPIFDKRSLVPAIAAPFCARNILPLFFLLRQKVVDYRGMNRYRRLSIRSCFRLDGRGIH